MKLVGSSPQPNRSQIVNEIRKTGQTLGRYLVVEEDKVHLNENEGHSRGGREGEHYVVTLCVSFELEVLAELESRVDH